MQSTVCLNQSNVINPSSGANQLVYKFPTSTQFSNHSIALQSISVYYSWVSISSALNNNSFSITIYPNDAWSQTFTVTIPDGAYNISDLNSYFKYWSIQNGLYMINDLTGEYSYLASFTVNAVKYAVEVQTFLSEPAIGWSLAPNFPAAGGVGDVWNAVLSFPAGFNLIIGYAAGFTTDPTSAGATPTPTPNGGVISNGTIAYLSSLAPQVQPNSTVLVSCNSIQNKYSQSPILYAFSSAGTAFGELIMDKPAHLCFSPLMPGIYSELRLTLLGTSLMPLAMQDPNITVLLIIQENV
jgi:hypothetical protein